MTKKERLLQDIQYAIDNKIEKFYIKSEIDGYKGLLTTIYVNHDLEQLKREVEDCLNENLIYFDGKTVSWGEFSTHETKYIIDVVLGDELGEEVYV